MKFSIILLLIFILRFYSYSLHEANTSVWLSGAAYCNKEMYGTMKLSGPATGFIVTNILYDKPTDLQGYIGLMTSTKTIYVVFRGSSSFLNWIDDLKIKKIPYDSYPSCNCTVHDGFYSTTMNLKSSVVESVSTLQKKYKYENVIITGHSLGAIVGQMMMMELQLYHIHSTVYNFGQPRGGDLNYANFVSLSSQFLYRFTHYKDVVPHIPPNEMNYYHSCNEIYEDESNELYNCTLCEDPTCSNQFSLRETNTADHSIYLGHELSCESSTIQ